MLDPSVELMLDELAPDDDSLDIYPSEFHTKTQKQETVKKRKEQSTDNTKHTRVEQKQAKQSEYKPAKKLGEGWSPGGSDQANKNPSEELKSEGLVLN